jgi:hypothetical protein
MTGRIRCTVVKTPTELEATLVCPEALTQDLQPWADPFIAQLAAKYRLRAALDDSLYYMTHESVIPRGKLPVTDRSQSYLPPHAPQIGPQRPAGILPHDGRRFIFPIEGESES